MGASESKDGEVIEMAPELQDVLDRNTYQPGPSAKYPYFLIQLSENAEKPFGDDAILVSDAIAVYLQTHRVTHIIAQTHGWNTPPDKAIAVPFTEFIGGMQNDQAMPESSDEFVPIFLAFIWPALPIQFAQSPDALTRAELLLQHERDNADDDEDSDIAQAAAAAKKAMEDENPDDEDLAAQLKKLVEAAHEDDEDDDDDDDDNAVRNGDADAVVNRAKDTPGSEAIETILNVFRPIMRPLETLVFGRLMKRGRRSGKIMGQVLGKLMRAAERLSGRPKVCMMANSLGAHMLVGVLKNGDALPYKIHTVFFVQGAITRDWFEQGRKFGQVTDMVAGPTMCSYSSRDLMLKNIYGPFHGTALGSEGSGCGQNIEMKNLDQMADEPYEFAFGCWNDVNCSEYIDEGNPVAGGHGDFKEDETTSLYWSAIKCEVEESAYEK